MSIFVHSMGGGGQKWVKFGLRSCWMTTYDKVGGAGEGQSNLSLLLGNVHKGRPIFCYDFWRYLPTYVLYSLHNVLSTYLICPIFLDISTYPKIGHPLWTLPCSRLLCIGEFLISPPFVIVSLLKLKWETFSGYCIWICVRQNCNRL